ncbi:MAG: DUF6503 family protein [Chitinophagales bacterium]
MRRNFIQKNLAVFILISLIACNSTTDKIADKSREDNLYSMLPDDTCGHIIKASIINAGGLESWQQKKALSYTKVIQEFDSAGSLLSEITQYHYFQLQPALKMRISWQDKDTGYLVIYDGDSAKKFVNGMQARNTEDYNDAWHSSWGSHYVLNMPFKLADGGANFIFEGTQNILNKKVLAIKVLYSGKDTSDKRFPWWYYFDPESKSLVAYATPGKNEEFGLTEYAGFENAEGLTLPGKRIGFMADKEKKPLYKTTIYINRDFRFFENASDSLFRSPVLKTNM